MSFEAPPGKRSMFGYLTIDLLNSVSGMSISERLQLQPYTCKWLVAFYCVSPNRWPTWPRVNIQVASLVN